MFPCIVLYWKVTYFVKTHLIPIYGKYVGYVFLSMAMLFLVMLTKIVFNKDEINFFVATGLGKGISESPVRIGTHDLVYRLDDLQSWSE